VIGKNCELWTGEKNGDEKKVVDRGLRKSSISDIRHETK
jgi:hypothetical protein